MHICMTIVGSRLEQYVQPWLQFFEKDDDYLKQGQGLATQMVLEQDGKWNDQPEGDDTAT